MSRIARIGQIAMIACLCVASTALADGDRIEVGVGETVERDVGFALGLRCDDLAIIRAELRASTPESNTFAVTGVAEGTTTCRVGTALGRPSYVFEIHVVPPHRPH